MQRIEHANGVITYSFDSLAQQAITAHVSTRHGGVSPAPWHSLNFSVSRGDTPENVRANRVRLAAALGRSPEEFVAARQVHGTGVAKVDPSHAGTVQDGVDALITDVPGLPLSLVFADCVPIVLFDPVTRSLGVCHAGWRGTVNGAAVATLWAMQAAFGASPDAVQVGIGPSIGPTSYEVGDEVVNMAMAKLAQPERYFHKPEGKDRYHFDLWQANAGQLIEAGVRADGIEIAAIDTAQHTDDFFSHRAEQGRCGLFGMVAWLA